MNRFVLFLIIATVAISAESDIDGYKERLKRDLSESDKRVVNVSAGPHIPIGTVGMIVDTEGTRKEQYLIWGETAQLRCERLPGAGC